MTVLVTAASKHGATREIAEAIARVLDEHGVSAECVDLDKVGDLGRYEAVVLGSAVYMGQWLKEARSFIDWYAGELAERPTWLFSSGPIVGDPPKPDPADEAAGIHALEAAHAREHKLFAGKVTRASSASSRRLPCAPRTRARATTATATRSSAGRPRSRRSFEHQPNRRPFRAQAARD